MVGRTLVPTVIISSMFFVGLTPKSAPAQIPEPLVSVVDIVVDSLDVVEDQFVANLLVTLNIVGQEIVQEVQVPIDLEGISVLSDCDILRLAVGPLDLNVLGLVVALDDCEGGPVIVDIDATTGPGQLLGNLLCPLLDSGLDLGDILALGALDEDFVVGLLNALLDNVLGGLSMADAMVSAHQVGAPGNSRRCDILNLELGALNLNLLGLEVVTSDICLDVFAVRGGGLLGNLLCGVVHLLDNPGNNLGGQLAHIRRILRLLDELDL